MQTVCRRMSLSYCVLRGTEKFHFNLNSDGNELFNTVSQVSPRFIYGLWSEKLDFGNVGHTSPDISPMTNSFLSVY